MNHQMLPENVQSPTSFSALTASKNRIFAALVMLIAFLAVSFSTVRNTDSDSRSTLLVSESLLQHHTVKLDHYGADAMAHYGDTVHEKNGHYYSYFPIGTSIASLPFVAIANGWGLEMLKSQGAVQIAIASLAAVLTLFLLIRLAALFLPASNAILLASVFWFGTSFASTDGTALWSHNFAAIFSITAIFFAIKATRFGMVQVWPIIAACLFMAYLCRPTLALLSPFLLLFLFSYHRIVAIKTGVLLAFLLFGLVAFSMHEWGQYLPDYYLPQRLSGNQFALALYGNLLSPARGLLVYSSFILLTWLCYRDSIRSLSLKMSWWLIGLAWPLMHWVAVSRFPVWAAGWSYGPRFMTDVLPGLFLLTIRSWPVSVPAGPLVRRTPIVLIALSSAFSVYANTWQGLFNSYTARWNMQPDIGVHPDYLFDWHYPQFLHNKKRHDARINALSANLGYIKLDFDPSWVRKEDAGMNAPYAMMSSARSARFTFTISNCFEVGMLKHGWSGIVRVSRDGTPVRDIDLYAKDTDRTFKAFFEQDSKPHTYTVEVTGEMNPKSGGSEVWVDGVIPRANCVAPQPR